MIPVSKRAKTVHALDRSATVTGSCSHIAEFISDISLLAPALTVSSLADFLIFSFNPEDGGNTFLRNIG
jgi:hypothetical protein